MEALAGTQENITLTAQELGVSRVTLYRMLRRHSINAESRTEGAAGRGLNVGSLARAGPARRRPVCPDRSPPMPRPGSATSGKPYLRRNRRQPRRHCGRSQATDAALGSRLKHADHGSGDRTWPWPRCQVFHCIDAVRACVVKPFVQVLPIDRTEAAERLGGVGRGCLQNRSFHDAPNQMMLPK